MGPQLEALTSRRPDVRLRIVDIESWDSPVARQYEVRRLPWLWLYRDGRRVSTDTREIVGLLNALQ